jgi:hypothetical protein
VGRVPKSPMSTRLDQPSKSSETTTAIESTAVTSLFPRVVALTVLLLVVLIAIRGKTGSKAFDHVAFGASVAGATVLTIRCLRKPTIPASRLALIVSLAGILCGIARAERPQMTISYWEGFGTSVVLLSVPLALLIVPISARVMRSRVLGLALAAPVVLLATVDGLSLIRDLHYFAAPDNNTFVLNEVLAPAAGRVPGASFIPQYTSLVGWGVVPFRHLVSPFELANVSTVVLSCFGICAVVLAIVLARRCLPENSLWLAVGLTVPLATVTVLHGSALESSIGGYFQELPLRMFPAMLYSLIAVDSLVALLTHSVRRVPIIALGLLGGLMVWNSQDFGIAVPIAYGLILLIATRGVVRKRATMLWLYGIIPGLMLYPLWTLAIGHPIQINYLALTAQSFGNGFASSPIQLPGPVLLVLPVILGSTAVGCFLLWQAAEATTTKPKFQQHAFVTLAFVGAWSTIAFVYYINRSFASAQLQIFLLPFGVCCCGLLTFCLAAISTGGGHLGASPLMYLRRSALWLLPVTLPIAVGFGAALQTPSPVTSFDALTHPPAYEGFNVTELSREVSIAKDYVQNHGGGAVGYFGPDANYLALSTGVQPRILYDDPLDFTLSPAAHHLGCEYVRHKPTEWLVAALGVTSIVGSSICDDYDAWPVPFEPPGTVFRLRQPATSVSPGIGLGGDQNR